MVVSGAAGFEVVGVGVAAVGPIGDVVEFAASGRRVGSRVPGRWHHVDLPQFREGMHYEE
jgi:hypothetical protein